MPGLRGRDDADLTVPDLDDDRETVYGFPVGDAFRTSRYFDRIDVFGALEAYYGGILLLYILRRRSNGMERKLLPTVFLVLVVLLAGCAGDSGDLAAGDDPDDTGDTGGEVTLVENRTAALMAAGSYTSVWEMASDSEGERVSAITYTHAVDYANERSTFGMRMAGEDGVSMDNEFFHADGTTYTRYGSGEEATYHVAEGEFAPEDTLFSVESSFASGSDLAEFSAVGTETYDGVDVTRYERTDRPTWVHNQAGDGEFSWTSFNYVVLVDDDGLVRYESWGGDAVDDEGVEHTITFSYSLTDVGSTAVEDPDWLAAADEQSNR